MREVKYPNQRVQDSTLDRHSMVSESQFPHPEFRKVREI
jgi:hypothetical protein